MVFFKMPPETTATKSTPNLKHEKIHGFWLVLIKTSALYRSELKIHKMLGWVQSIHGVLGSQVQVLGSKYLHLTLHQRNTETHLAPKVGIA